MAIAPAVKLSSVLMLLALALRIADAGAVPPGPGSLDPAFGKAGSIAIEPLETPVAVLPQADGNVLVAAQFYTRPEGAGRVALARYDATGAVDTQFGNAGLVVTKVSYSAEVRAALQQPDGKVIVAGFASDEQYNGAIFLLRYNADGTLDSAFGAAGVASTPTTISLDPQQLLRLPDGRFIVISLVTTPPPAQGPIAMTRYRADGSVDSTLGGIVIVEPALLGGRPAAAVMQPDGKFVVAAGTRVARFDAGGILDAGFGFFGVATLPMVATGLTLTADNQIVASGVVAGPRIALIRIASDGKPAPGFGNAGVVVTPVAAHELAPCSHIQPSPNPGATAIEQADGRLVVIATDHSYSAGATQYCAHIDWSTVLVRYEADGTIDPSFGAAGVAAVPSGLPVFRSARLQADGNLLVGADVTIARYLLDVAGTRTSLTSSRNPLPAGEGVTFTATIQGHAPTGTVRFRNGDITIAGCEASVVSGAAHATCATATFAAHPGANAISATYSGDAVNPASRSPDYLQSVVAPSSDVAIEFYNAQFDDYFLTSSALEIAGLDQAAAAAGWRRTGQFFLVYPAGAPLSVPACRFFSGGTFAPLTTHFYTPFADECALLRSDPAWMFEGDVLPIRLPDAQGQCPPQTMPLYRMHNNGLTPASNHRFTIDRAVVNEMYGKGWRQEGNGPDYAAGCARDAAP